MKPLYIFMFLFLLSCTKEKTDVSSVNQKKEPENVSQSNAGAADETVSDSVKIRQLNEDLLKLFQTGNYAKLTEYIHPEKGVRFSMYAYVKPETDKKFTRSDYIAYHDSSVKFTWGERDGSGEPLVLSLRDYFSQWVFKRDFSKAAFSINRFLGSGNSLNNLETVYPHTVFTENYIAGSEEFSGMDWHSLRFVFEEFEGKFYLVAIVNDEWTV